VYKLVIEAPRTILQGIERGDGDRLRGGTVVHERTSISGLST